MFGFGSKTIVGLDVGSSSIKAVELKRKGRDIEVAQSINELQQIIADRATTVPAQAFITCIGGWNRAGFKETRLPTQAELNAAAPRNPVYLAESGGGGAGITNAAAAAFFTAHGVPVNADGTVGNTTNAKRPALGTLASLKPTPASNA